MTISLPGRPKRGIQQIPRAPGWLPLIGHTVPLLRDPLRFLRTLSGTGEIVRVDVGTLPIYFVTTPQLVHDINVTMARSFEKGRIFERLRPLVGEGLGTASNDVHRRHRRLIQPIFSNDHIAEYSDTFSKCARSFANSWRGDEVIDVQQAMLQLTIGTLNSTMFSTYLDEAAAESVRQDLPVIFRDILVRAVSPRFLDRLRAIPANRRFDAATNRLKKVIDDVIARARQNIDGPTRANLLTLLLAAHTIDDDAALTDQEVRDELTSFLFAGAETQASTLAWAFYEISKRPDVEKRLTAEIDAIVYNGAARIGDISKLKYTMCVINEVARMHSVTLVMRRTVKMVRFGDLIIPEGTELAYSLYAMHRDPSIFREPDQFDPDRWLAGQSQHIPRDAFIPFGSGKRKCPGDTFAMTQIPIALATILSQWRLRPIPGVAVREAAAVSPHPKRLVMTIAPR